MSPVRSDLEEIVGKKAGGASSSPSPSPAPREGGASNSKSFIIGEPKSAPTTTNATSVAVEMKQVGLNEAKAGSVFKMATFAESGTEYAKVTKPVVEYK